MKIKIEKLPKSRIKLEIEAPAEDIASHFEKAYKNLAETVEIKGFRKGMAPKAMVIDAVGQNRYNSEALNSALQDIYYKALTQEKIMPVSQPAISITKFTEGESFIFTAEIDILPKIELGDYKKIKIKHEKQEFVAKKEELGHILKRLQYQSAKFEETDQAAKKDDRIEINFKGSVGHVVKEKYCSNNYPLVLGEGILVPGFEDKLVGMKKGESKKFELEVNKEKVEFEVKMIDIKKVSLPELNDEFAKKFGRKSLTDLKEAISKNVVMEKAMHDKEELETKIFDEMLKIAKADIPDGLIDQEINRRIAKIQEQTGPGFAEFLKKSGKSMTDLRQELKPEAERSVKIGLMLGEVSKDLGLIKDNVKTEEDQKKVVRETLDKLAEIMVK